MTRNKSGKQTLLIEACFISVKDILTTILGQKFKKKFLPGCLSVVKRIVVHERQDGAVVGQQASCDVDHPFTLLISLHDENRVMILDYVMMLLYTCITTLYTEER